MLYEAIRLGCRLYHRSQWSYNDAYRNYLWTKDATKWGTPERLDTEEVRKLIAFANRWRCRMPSDMLNTKLVLGGLKRATPDLNLLGDNTILDVQFDEGILATTVSR